MVGGGLSVNLEGGSAVPAVGYTRPLPRKTPIKGKGKVKGPSTGDMGSGVTWTEEEELALAKAGRAARQEVIAGMDQTIDELWDKPMEHFKTMRVEQGADWETEGRMMSALQHR